MGVHGLWNLLEPSGKPVPLESLENKVLAVDVSIWLHQLVKGYQDSRGNALPNAHLLGLFHRICKLLFYKIKPVFVFDGDVPLLKKQTVANRQQQKGKLQDDADQVRQKLAKNILKHTAIKKVLGTDVVEHQAHLNMAKLQLETDMFELPPLKPSEVGETEGSEIDYMSSSDDEDDESPCKHVHADLHSIDVKSEDFKALPADIRHDILTELKETRKQSSWGRLHEMPEESGQFSSFQMNRLLKRRNFQVSLEEAEKEMGGRTMSLGELGEMLNDQGVMTNTNLDLGKRIASDSTTRFVYIREAAKKTLFSSSTSSAAIKPSERDNSKQSTNNSISSLQNSETDAGNSKHVQLSDCPIEKEDEFEQDWSSESDTDETKGTVTDNSKSTYDLAKGFMFVASSLTQDQIDKFVNKSHKSPDKSKRTAVSTGCKSSNRTNVGMSAEESIPGTSNNYVPVTVEEELDYIGIISDETESDVEEVEINEKEIKPPLEIIIKPDIKYDIEEDLFADVFLNIEHDLIQKQKQIEEIAQSYGEYVTSNLVDNASKITNRQDVIIDIDEIVGLQGLVDPSMQCAKKNNVEQSDRPVLKEQIKEIAVTLVGEVNKREASKQEKVELITKQNDMKHLAGTMSICADKEKESKIENAINVLDVDKLVMPVCDLYSSPCKATTDEQTNIELNEGESRITIEDLGIQIDENQDDFKAIPKQIIAECNIIAESQTIVSQESKSKDCNSSTVSSLPLSASKTSSANMNVTNTIAIKDNMNAGTDVVGKALEDETFPESDFVLEDSYYGEQVDEEDDVSLTQPSTSTLPEKLTTVELQGMQASLEVQHNALLLEKGKTERMAASITTQMCIEAQELLRLFGLPYLNAPMEAEAQCAFLDSISLTDGTISDDSDIWLFGGRKVYKNFFNQKKHVMQFTSSDIRNILKLARNQMILLALLTGSDYTSGLTGVGPVTALEIIAAFPSGTTDDEATVIDDLAFGLRKFREWFRQGRPVGPGTAKLRNKLKDLELGDGFPSSAVIEGYLRPTIDESKEKFTWGKPDLEKLREYAREKFGWTRLKLDDILLPVMKKLDERTTQKSLDSYFQVQVKLPTGEGKLSKRVQKAVRRIGTEETNSDVEDDPLPLKKCRKKANMEKNESNEAAKSKSKKGKAKVKPGQAVTKCVKPQTDTSNLATNSEFIPQREKDRLSALKNKLKAIEMFRTSKSGLDKTKRPRKPKRLEKAEAELSESSSD